MSHNKAITVVIGKCVDAVVASWLSSVCSVTVCCCFISGETDWKVLAINVNDPLAQQLNGKPLLRVLGIITVSF